MTPISTNITIFPHHSHHAPLIFYKQTFQIFLQKYLDIVRQQKLKINVNNTNYLFLEYNLEFNVIGYKNVLYPQGKCHKIRMTGVFLTLRASLARCHSGL